eukprot:1508905-Prymnesium_polylepis.1
MLLRGSTGRPARAAHWASGARPPTCRLEEAAPHVEKVDGHRCRTQGAARGAAHFAHTSHARHLLLRARSPV